MHFRPIGDALKCILFNTPSGPNLAATRDEFVPDRLPVSVTLLKESLSARKECYTLLSWDGPHLRSLASTRMRAGARSWEIERLYLPVKQVARNGTRSVTDAGLNDEAAAHGFVDSGTDVVELLEALSLYAGSRGAERLFLRVPWGSPIISVARRTGFFPYFDEALLHGSGSRGGQRHHVNLALRPRFPHEEYAIFQLYSASTPSPVRAGTGMSFEQWKDSRERGANGTREDVYERDGKIMAWLGADPSGASHGARPVQMALMVHPDEAEVLPALVDHALAGEGEQMWLVPDYQEFLSKLLIHRGFKEASHYSTLIKTMAVRAGSPSLTAAEVRVWQQ